MTKYCFQSNLPCSPAATAKVRGPLVVAGKDLVGVHPPSELAVPSSVILPLVLKYEIHFRVLDCRRYKRTVRYGIRKNFGVFNPLPLVSVQITQPISIIVRCWANPLPPFSADVIM